MHCERGRARRGERLRAAVPRGHWKTVAFVAGLRNAGIVAAFVPYRPVDLHAFEVHVSQILVEQTNFRYRPAMLGALVRAQPMAAHENPRTTKHDDRTKHRHAE